MHRFECDLACFSQKIGLECYVIVFVIVLCYSVESFVVSCYVSGHVMEIEKYGIVSMMDVRCDIKNMRYDRIRPALCNEPLSATLCRVNHTPPHREKAGIHDSLMPTINKLTCMCIEPPGECCRQL